MQFTAPPRSMEFSKFIEFVGLLTDPKQLRQDLDTFGKATKEYNKAFKQYSDAVKIASTVEEAETIKEKNEEKSSLLKIAAKAMDSREQLFNEEMDSKRKTFDATMKSKNTSLDEKANAIDNLIRSHDSSVEKQDAVFTKREDTLKAGEANLDRELKSLEEKKVRVDEAYAA